MRAQGATEYLVLLAVVLVIALVGIALLGFFPGTASDAQIAESQIYWQSASPIAITEWNAVFYVYGTFPYIRVKNTGPYPLRLTGIVGGDGGKATQIWCASSSSCGTPVAGSYNITDFYYMAPGEERYFAWASPIGLPCERQIVVRTSTSTGYNVGGAASVCQNSSSSPGVVEVKNFGFEYIAYIEGQQITKRQIGTKPLIIKCREPY